MSAARTTSPCDTVSTVLVYRSARSGTLCTCTAGSYWVLLLFLLFAFSLFPQILRVFRQNKTYFTSLTHPSLSRFISLSRPNNAGDGKGIRIIPIGKARTSSSVGGWRRLARSGSPQCDTDMSPARMYLFAAVSSSCSAWFSRAVPPWRRRARCVGSRSL